MIIGNVALLKSDCEIRAFLGDAKDRTFSNAEKRLLLPELFAPVISVNGSNSVLNVVKLRKFLAHVQNECFL